MQEDEYELQHTRYIIAVVMPGDSAIGRPQALSVFLSILADRRVVFGYLGRPLDSYRGPISAIH
jgi:hypothetical protein